MDQPEQLLALLASQGELIGSLTHDIKGLMTGLTGGIYLIDSGLAKENEQRVTQGLEMLKRNLARLERTVSSVQYYVKDRELDPGPLQLDQVVAGVDAVYAAQDETLTVVETGTGAFESDGSVVHAMLIDLIDYARAACPDQLADVGLESALDGEQVVFTVTARGATVTPEVLEQLQSGCYTPLFGDRVHLGLFIASKLARQLGGALQVCPESGTTRFIARIPGL